VKIDGDFTIRAPLPKVWDALLDPQIVGPCVPGCSAIEVISPTDYRATVTLEIGPIKAGFKVAVTVTEIVPQVSVTCLTKGEERIFQDGSGRLELAQAIIDPQNPLTARVIVNRIWQYHLGTGIVATPGDFGRMGSRPTHPELLDYLASYFVENGWSMKKVHRLIMLSNTYRQSSDYQTKAAEADPDNKLMPVNVLYVVGFPFGQEPEKFATPKVADVRL